MATKAKKAKKAKKTSATSKTTRVVAPDWSGSYTISQAQNTVTRIMLDGVNPNKITLTKLGRDKGIGGVDTYLCQVANARPNSYWHKTVFAAVASDALTAVPFKDNQDQTVSAPYPAATLANTANVQNLFAKVKRLIDGKTERLLGAIIDNGKIKYLCLYRIRKSLKRPGTASRGDVIFLDLYDPATDVDGGFPGGWGTGTRP